MPIIPSTVLIFGPQASGKTLNAERLKELYNCIRIVDNWQPGDGISKGDLLLATMDTEEEALAAMTDKVHYVGIVHICEALAILGNPGDSHVKQTTVQTELTSMVEGMHKQVAKFNAEVTGVPTPETGIEILPSSRLAFRVGHVLEELQELIDADNAEDAGDACLDGVYVLLGAMYEMGIKPGPFFDEIQRANMDKERGQVAKRQNSGYDAVKPEGWKGPDNSWVNYLSDVLVECAKIRAAKDKDYNNGNAGIELTDYFPLGLPSYYQMLHVKMLRIRSMVDLDAAGDTPNHESLRDSLMDMINYCTYTVEHLDRQVSASEVFNKGVIK